jgi:hypothetical protein
MKFAIVTLHSDCQIMIRISSTGSMIMIYRPVSAGHLFWQHHPGLVQISHGADVPVNLIENRFRDDLPGRSLPQDVAVIHHHHLIAVPTDVIGIMAACQDSHTALGDLPHDPPDPDLVAEIER